MGKKEGNVRFAAVVCLTLLVGLTGWPVVGSATTRVGNSEIQLAYEQQHAFQFDSGEYGIDWVQWRHELRLEWQYNDLISEGRLFDRISLPLIKNADFWLMYRGRFDPVYLVRDRYQKIFDDETRHNFVVPENDIREVYLDADFGEVGPGSLSMRLGRQQIVWGESDLFRSLDVVNPLRLDQNGLVGEAFEDFRTPIWALKFLYSIGTWGPFSELGIEPFYTPRWRPLTTDLIGADSWRVGRNGRPQRIGVGPHGEPLFTDRDPDWYSRQRSEHPWTVVAQGQNARRDAPDFGCVFLSPELSLNPDGTFRCAPDVPGDRSSFIYNMTAGNVYHHAHGTRPDLLSMFGVRILGKTYGNVDFTLNYLYKRAEASDTLKAKDLFDLDQTLATGTLVPRTDRLYGFGIPGQDLATGIDRCLGPGNTGESALLNGVDLRGFNANANPRDDRGGGFVVDPTTGQQSPVYQDGRPVPLTACARPYQHYPWTHVFGFTLTYNDFDYTGAVFRVEQSYWTKERFWQRPPFPFPGKRADDPYLGPDAVRRFIKTDGKRYSPMWRSMIGFDLVQSYASFPGMGWARNLPGGIGTQQTFFTAQLLSEYQFDNLSNLFPSRTSDAPYDRVHRWNWMFTFSTSGNYFRGKLEPTLSFAQDLTVNFPLLFAQTFWHGLYFKNLDLLGGVVLYMGSKNAGSPFLLNQYANKDTAFIRLIYYLL